MKNTIERAVLFFILSAVMIGCGANADNPEILVESISLSQPSAEIEIGETLALKATVLPSNAKAKDVFWASSKNAVATVSENGIVNAIAEGKTTITASAGGKAATCQITVVDNKIAVESIVLDKEELNLEEGQTETLTATISPKDATDNTIVWMSSSESVAEVKDGIVSAISEGTTIITASAGKQSATCVVYVSKKTIPVESITLDKENVTLEKEETLTLKATINPENATDKTIVWSSSNSAIVSVEQTGIIKAVSGGTAVIEASCGGKTAHCTVLVNIPIEYILLSDSYITAPKGVRIKLSVEVFPEDATDIGPVAWTVTDQSIVQILSTESRQATFQIIAESGKSKIIATLGEHSSSAEITANGKYKDYASGDGSIDNPFNAYAANQYASGLTWTSTSDFEKTEPVYVSGIVAEVKEYFSSAYGNASFYISATGSTEQTTFYVYRTLYLGNQRWKDSDRQIKVGDYVKIYGPLMNYKGYLPETVANCSYIVSWN